MGYRLHVFCGESLLCHTANYLKYGTTALVVMLLNQGEHIGPGPFVKPIQRELKRLNRDISLSARFEMERGGCLTALEIQEWILADVAARRDRLPDWASLVIERWENMLADLRAGSPAAAQSVDWLIYKDCLAQVAAEYGMDAGQLAALNRRITYRQSGRKTVLDVPPDLMELRSAACELYIRLHVPGEQSLFSLLGGQESRLAEVTDERIAEAVEHPPPGRAANRAAFVRKYHGTPRFQVSWDMIVDVSIPGTLEIPGESAPEWEKAPLVFAVHPDVGIAQRREADFRQGDYHKVIEQFGRVNPSVLDWAALNTYALSFARLGMRKQALDLLDLLRTHITRFQGIAEELFCTVNFGLAPPLEEMKTLIDEGNAILSAGTENHDLFVYQQNTARFLTLQGRYDEAKALFKEVLERETADVKPRMVSRTECYYAELLRLSGDAAGAQEYAGKAITRQGAHQLIGDIAEYALPMLAKLMPDGVAASLLNQAMNTQKIFRHELSQARLVCLRARRLREDRCKEEFDRLRGRVPVLQTCPVAARIADNWEEWIHPNVDDQPMDYWGL
jgi:tetratricopeptide (TPR) repeat protein